MDGSQATSFINRLVRDIPLYRTPIHIFPFPFFWGGCCGERIVLSVLEFSRTCEVWASRGGPRVAAGFRPCVTGVPGDKGPYGLEAQLRISNFVVVHKLVFGAAAKRPVFSAGFDMMRWSPDYSQLTGG